jgi:hypothetical protein
MPRNLIAGPDAEGRYRCSTCNEWRPLTGFHTNTGTKRGLSNRCRECHADYVRTDQTREKNREHARRRTAEARALLAKLRDQPCADCGGRFPACCMEFDHIDPAGKMFTLPNLIGGGITKRFLDEIAKCQVLCANCHRIRTHAIGLQRRAKGRLRKASGER